MTPSSPPVDVLWSYKGGFFSYVSHFTHLDLACGIIRDGVIKPSETTDSTCVLKQLGVPVIWLWPEEEGAPNTTWGDLGCHFGGVEFSIPVKNLFQGRRIYQLSNNPNHKKEFRRFLITKGEYPAPLSLYNFQDNEDPWGGPYLSGNWESYRYLGKSPNFLIDEGIPLESVSFLGTIGHSSFYCVRSESCPDKGMSSEVAEANLLRSVVSQKLHQAVRFFAKQEEQNTIPTPFLLRAWSRLLEQATKGEAAAETVNRLRAEIATFFQIPEARLTTGETAH